MLAYLCLSILGNKIYQQEVDIFYHMVRSDLSFFSFNLFYVSVNFTLLSFTCMRHHIMADYLMVCRNQVEEMLANSKKKRYNTVEKPCQPLYIILLGTRYMVRVLGPSPSPQ